MAIDEEEAVQPIKKKRSRWRLTSDRIVVGTGVTLAAASAFFPWYVFFNEDKFGVRTLPMESTRDLPAIPGRNVFSVSPLALVDRDDLENPEAMPDPLDNLTTATVSSLGAERDNGALAQDQPFPGRSTFRLMHVANGRALIENGSGMYMVRVGSVLPDNSRLATIEQRDGRWVIITSNGEIYRDEVTGSP
jgi:hypothetical protein